MIGLNGVRIQFPLTYDLKVIMVSQDDNLENEKKIRSILNKLEIKTQTWNQKFSSQGKYISYSVNITLNNQYKMDSLYQELKLDPNIKFAI